MLNMKIESGDILELVQENGETMIFYVKSDGITVKASIPGSHLEISRDSTYLLRISAERK